MRIALRIISSFRACAIALLFAAPAAAQTQWQRLHPSLTPQELFGMTYANGLFVAVGAYNTILTSPDAVSWTPRSAEGDTLLTEVAYGNGLFVAAGLAGCGDAGTALRTSSDG